MTPAAAKGEIGFFRGLVRPYFSVLAELFPSLQGLVDNIDANIAAMTIIAEASN